MDVRTKTLEIMSAMEQGRVGPLVDAMDDDVVWQWRGVAQWSRSFTGKQVVIDTLFGGATDSLGASSSVTLLDRALMGRPGAAIPGPFLPQGRDAIMGLFA